MKVYLYWGCTETQYHGYCTPKGPHTPLGPPWSL